MPTTGTIVNNTSTKTGRGTPSPSWVKYPEHLTEDDERQIQAEWTWKAEERRILANNVAELDTLVTTPPKNRTDLNYMESVDYQTSFQSKIPVKDKSFMDMLGDDFLEICVTFTDNLRCNYKERTLTKIVEDGVLLAIKNRRCNPIYYFLGEYSKTGQFHFHGMLRGFNGAALAALKRILNHTCGRTTISMVKYPDSYKEYVYKQYSDNLPDNIFEIC